MTVWVLLLEARKRIGDIQATANRRRGIGWADCVGDYADFTVLFNGIRGSSRGDRVSTESPSGKSKGGHAAEI